jgi:hypothetical protein
VEERPSNGEQRKARTCRSRGSRAYRTLLIAVQTTVNGGSTDGQTWLILSHCAEASCAAALGVVVARARARPPGLAGSRQLCVRRTHTQHDTAHSAPAHGTQPACPRLSVSARASCVPHNVYIYYIYIWIYVLYIYYYIHTLYTGWEKRGWEGTRPFLPRANARAPKANRARASKQNGGHDQPGAGRASRSRAPAREPRHARGQQRHRRDVQLRGLRRDDSPDPSTCEG